MDGVVVVVSVLAVTFPSVSALSALRAIRPLRLVARSKRMQVRVRWGLLSKSLSQMEAYAPC
jgi:hypothetical protein